MLKQLSVICHQKARNMGYTCMLAHRRIYLCPNCKSHLPGNERTVNSNERFGLHRYNFLGWCEKCQCGFEFDIFFKSGIWFVHRWRKYIPNGQNEYKKSEWTIENDLPIPAVKIGEGKEYDKNYCYA